MFTHIFVLVAALTTITAAVPTNVLARDSSGTCNAGELLCCNNLLNSDSAAAAEIATQQGITLPNNQVIGVQCQPIVVNGASCIGEVTFCSNNLNGLVFADCIPPNVGV